VNLSPYLRAFAIGSANGLRTFTAPAATARAGGSPWTGVLATLAFGELIGDKLPITPSRMSPPALSARAVAGGLCGGSVAVRLAGHRAGGIAVGAVAAIVGAWLGFTIRRYLTTEIGWPDPLVALVEDGVAIWGSIAASPATGD
jgi:uncharacterized membrane protein